ncbi:hypothetical protein IGI37_000064 [Enterococcus sp. AZ194]|uniref:hypothetical protein n=1 Tax=Enterococcus sp. AZ194 TaxID=2774629 RepID=UPI003F280E93
MSNRLSKDELSLLHYLTSISGKLDVTSMYTTREALASKIEIIEIDSVLTHLLELKLLEKLERHGNEPCYYAATTKAKNTLEFLESDRKDKVKWSIYVPLAVTLGANILIKIVELLLKQ